MWWAFDIATLWACFEAFGASPAVGVLVVGYFVGTLANLLPLPGGVGGVDGGMIGAFVAFGVDPAAAIVAVLAYRFFAFWLPIAPGAVSFASLRRTVSKWEAEDAGEAARGAQARPPPHRASARALPPVQLSHGRFRRLLQRPRLPAAHAGDGRADATAQSLAWADNAIKLAVDMTVAAINRVNIQGTTEQQAQQIRTVMATVFPEAVTLVREARQGLQ